eukprot:TRINITY_DN8347_c0_g1_i4.p1 TRINITY_DN8347_c0_g1~~TRINITY_DN8347_c0_g1_i4.p1  ORF type:complete len:618 (-),score=165.13 TRINITY_DN8347_c0_g1_i4:71-1924(-)
MDKCSSIHLALKIHFCITGAMEDGIFPKKRVQQLLCECEMAAVNSTMKQDPTMDFNALTTSSPGTTSGTTTPTSEVSIDSAEEPSNGDHIDKRSMHELTREDSINTLGKKLEEIDVSKSPMLSHQTPREELSLEDAERKRSRLQFFHSQLEFITSLTRISTALKRKGVKTRQELNTFLLMMLEEVETKIVASQVQPIHRESTIEWTSELYLPLCSALHSSHRVVSIAAKESFCLNSRDRVPYMIFLEVIGADDVLSPPVGLKDDGDIPKANKMPDRVGEADDSVRRSLDFIVAFAKPDHATPHTKECQEKHENDDWVLMDGTVSAQAMAFRELFSEKKDRIRKQSPFGLHPKWDLLGLIVKAGDDLRQEQLAMQLIKTFHQIFVDEELPLWLRPYNVLALTSTTGLIEAIPDAISIDTIKKRIPNMKNLHDYYISSYGHPHTMSYIDAQRNFVESLAGYSLVCYILQIKDRHNGNLMIDKDGHIIHIDYGYMLSSSPGSLNFEADFKLTQEFIDVMGGQHNVMFQYFKLLFTRGFLEVRKHYKRILLLVEMMLPGHKMGCFAEKKEQTLNELKNRFQMNLSEVEAIAFVSELIGQNVASWRTESYDNYQYYTNGILV